MFSQPSVGVVVVGINLVVVFFVVVVEVVVVLVVVVLTEVVVAAAVVVLVAGGFVVDFVGLVVGLGWLVLDVGTGGQGQLSTSGFVGPLTHPGHMAVLPQ